MLRSAIAALLIVTLSILAVPCAFAATPQHASHDCCAPSIQANRMDCCNSASPHPATAPAQDRGLQSYLDAAVASSLRFEIVPSFDNPSLALRQSPLRVPATILRT